MVRRVKAAFHSIHFVRHCSATHSASSVLPWRTLWSTMNACATLEYLRALVSSAYNAARAMESTPPLMAMPSLRRPVSRCHLSQPVFSRAASNSLFVIGRLACSLYHLVLRHAAAEEAFL